MKEQKTKEKFNQISKLANSFFERKLDKNRSFEYRYLLWQIKENWGKIVSEIIEKKSEVGYLYGKKLWIYVNDANIHHIMRVCEAELIDKINNYLGKEAITQIEFRFIQGKLRKERLEKKEKKVEKSAKKSQKFEEMEISPSVLHKIEKNMDKIDEKYAHFKEKVREISINFAKKEQFLLSQGYVKCENCGDLFLEKRKNAKRECFSCVEKEKTRKLDNMLSLIKAEPFISEKEAKRLANGDKSLYYKARDILSEQIYDDLIFFTEEKKLEIEENEDYQNYYISETKRDFEILVRMYLEYKIGTKDEEVLALARRDLLRTIKKQLNYRKKYKNNVYLHRK